MKKTNVICNSKLGKYFKITENALKIVKKSITRGKEKKAKEIIDMVFNYLKDAKYFKGQGNYVNAFACINYAHGWLDSGARLGIFKVKNTRLFVVK